MRLLPLLLSACLMLMLAACGDSGGYTVQIDPPKTMPKQVDVVTVNNPAGLALIASVSSQRWFRDRDRIIAARPDEISVEHFEIVPGTKQIVYTIDGSGVSGVYIFTNGETGTKRTEAARF